MKYHADRYHVNLRQKNTNVCHSFKQIPTFISESPKHKYQEVHSYNKIEIENKSLPKGMITFGQVGQHQMGGFIKMKQRTSLEDFDNSSLNQSPCKSRGVTADEKLTNLLHNAVRLPYNVKPSSSTNIPPICRINVHSTREIMDIPRHPPLYPRVTVRFT